MFIPKVQPVQSFWLKKFCFEIVNTNYAKLCYKLAVAYLGFGKGEPWRARGARAYNGGLGAEQSPPKAETLFASECSMKTANSPIFQKFGNAKDHQTLLNFAILAGKW